jgi:hypothetical protein
MILLAAFAQLRFGELVALRRSNINLPRMELRVRFATAEMEDGTQVDGDPKSEAGKRPISLPAGLRGDVEAHLGHFAQAGCTADCSWIHTAVSRVGATSTGFGGPQLRAPTSRMISIFTFTTCGTPVAPGRRRVARRSRS